MSNLPYISKFLERVVTAQLNDNQLLDKLQSAYRAGFSTVPALQWVMNDLLCSVNGGKALLPTLLDLNATFDTTDHGLLLQRLQVENSIRQPALSCFCSHLVESCQDVAVNIEASANTALQYLVSLKGL